MGSDGKVVKDSSVERRNKVELAVAVRSTGAWLAGSQRVVKTAFVVCLAAAVIAATQSQNHDLQLFSSCSAGYCVDDATCILGACMLRCTVVLPPQC
jgi:hypothetical protein